MLAFWALPFFGPALPERATLAWAVLALSLLLHFPFFYGVAKDSWSDGALGASSMACGLLGLATLVVARKTRAEPESSIYALLGGTSLLFFTAAFPILLSNEWLTVAWALEAAALAWLRLRVKHRGLLVAAALLGAGTLARLLVNPAVLEYHPRSGAPILNWWLYTYGVSALALLAAWWLFEKGNDEDAKKTALPAFFAFAGGLLLFVLLNIEIADFYSSGDVVAFRFSGGGFQQDMTYTLAWGVFALALFGIGMATRSKPARIWAIVLVCATVGKGALHDVWALGSLYRVGAIVGLAVTLLAVSYLTQRFVLRAEGEPARPASRRQNDARALRSPLSSSYASRSCALVALPRTRRHAAAPLVAPRSARARAQAGKGGRASISRSTFSPHAARGSPICAFETPRGPRCRSSSSNRSAAAPPKNGSRATSNRSPGGRRPRSSTAAPILRSRIKRRSRWTPPSS